MSERERESERVLEKMRQSTDTALQFLVVFFLNRNTKKKIPLSYHAVFKSVSPSLSFTSSVVWTAFTPLTHTHTATHTHVMINYGGQSENSLLFPK